MPVAACHPRRSRQRAGIGLWSALGAGCGLCQQCLAGREGAAHIAGKGFLGNVRAWHRRGHSAAGEPRHFPQRSSSLGGHTVALSVHMKRICESSAEPACDLHVTCGRMRSRPQLQISQVRMRARGRPDMPCQQSCCHTRRRSCCPSGCFRLSACARWTSRSAIGVSLSGKCQTSCRRCW